MSRLLLTQKRKLENDVPLLKKINLRLQIAMDTQGKIICILQILSLACPDGISPPIFSFSLFK